MPRVPYERQLGAAGPVQIRPASTPFDNTRSGVSHIGDELGAGAQALGNQALGIISAERDKADAVAVTQAQQELESYRNDRGYNPKDGFFNLKGQNAISASTSFYDDVGKKRAEIAKRLNERQLAAFNKFAGGLELDTKRAGEQYVSHQVDEVAKGTFAAKQQTSLESLALNYADPMSRGRAMQEAATAAQLEAARQGFSPEERQAFVRKTIGDGHEVVLKQFIATGDGEKAAAYFAQPGVEESLGAKAPTMRAAVLEAGLSTRADKVAQEVVGSSRFAETGFVDEAKAFDALDKADLPANVKERAREKLKTRIVEARSARDSTINNYFGRAADAFLKSGTLSSVNAVDKAWLQAHSPDDWHKLEGWAAQKRGEREGRGPTARQRQDTMTLLADMEDNPDRYRSMPAETFRRKFEPLLGDKGYGTVYDDFLRYKHAKPEQPRPAEDLRLSPEAKAVVLQRGRAAGIFRDKAEDWNADEADRFHLIYTDVAQREAAMKAAGKSPTPQDIESWVAPYLVRGKVKDTGILFDDEVARVEYDQNPKYQGKEFRPKPDNDAFRKALRPEPEPGTAPAASTGGVPAEQRQLIVAAFRQNKGRDPTPAEVLDTYKRSTGRR